MHTHRIKVDVPDDKTVILDNLPFDPGQAIEIVVRPLSKRTTADQYPLRGIPIQYKSPTAPVAESDWEATA